MALIYINGNLFNGFDFCIETNANFMTNKIIIKNLLLGFLSWIIPFAVSFLFYKPGGELVVPYSTFKSAIMVVGVLSGCYLLLQYFKSVSVDFVLNGLMVGLSWLAINIILDALILVPMMNSTFADYFMSIGLGYLSIPVISITMGYLIQGKQK